MNLTVTRFAVAMLALTAAAPLMAQSAPAEALSPFTLTKPPLLQAGGDAPAGIALKDEPVLTEDQERQKLITSSFLHGFRLGFMYINEGGNVPLADEFPEGMELKSNLMFLIGYEFFYRMMGQSWLNVLLVGNVLVAGLEQSLFLPSGNFMIGFEFNRRFQLGVGINLTPSRTKASHMIAAFGWTPLVGAFYVPVHLYFIPDPDGNFRTGATVGVSW